MPKRNPRRQERLSLTPVSHRKTDIIAARSVRPFLIGGRSAAVETVMAKRHYPQSHERGHPGKPPPGAADHLEDRRAGAVSGYRGGPPGGLGPHGLGPGAGLALLLLGRGSNLLIADAGLPGLTLHLARSLQGLSRRGDTLRAGAGVALPRLARTAAALGFSGFEFLAGIPGSVGAAVRLNAGADGQDLAAVLGRVWVATPRLQLLEFRAAELGLGYRSSRLLYFPHWLVVSR